MGSYVPTGERFFAFSSGHRLARRAMENMNPYRERGFFFDYKAIEPAVPGMREALKEGREKKEFAVEIENKPGEPLYFITREDGKKEWKEGSL